MRVMSWIFYALAVLAAVAACVFYVYLSGLACSFGGVNGPCRIRAPWQLGAEDLRFMVLYPLAIVLGLAAIGWLFGRRAR